MGDAGDPRERGFTAQLDELRNRTRRLDPMYRAVALVLLISIPLPFIVVGLSPSGFSGGTWSGPTLYAGIAGLGALLVWLAVSTPRWMRRVLDGLPALVAAMEGFSPQSVGLERDWARHPVVRGTLTEGDLAVPVTLEFRVAAWEAVEASSYFPRLIVHTPWNRPDDLLVSGWRFFSTFEAFRALEVWAFRKDLWRNLGEGLYSNRSLKRLQVRLVEGKRESMPERAQRLAGAFGAFRSAVRLSLGPPGALSPHYVEEPTKIALPLVFGFYLLAYCSECCHIVGRARGDAPRCPKCNGSLTKMLVRSQLDWKDPREPLRELARFADEANARAPR